MKHAGLSNYVLPDEGELGLNKVARVASDIVSNPLLAYSVSIAKVALV